MDFKKAYLFIFFSLATYTLVNGQQYEVQSSASGKDFTNTFYIEIGGNALLGSFNYDLVLPSSFGIRVGISPTFFLFALEEDQNYYKEGNVDFIAVLSGFKLHGKDSNKFETGLGIVFGEATDDFLDKYGTIPGVTLNMGYRFVPVKKKGLSIRAMFTPIINSEGFVPKFGLSVGLSFRNN